MLWPVRSVIIAIVLASLAASCFAERIARSRQEVTAFKRANPCPSTGLRRGACPGYVVDHVWPLCAGGPDRLENMQWQTVPDAKRKDIGERRQCRALRRVSQ